MSEGHAMRSWPALLLSPLLLLGAQSIAYSLATPSCARQDEALLLPCASA